MARAVFCENLILACSASTAPSTPPRDASEGALYHDAPALLRPANKSKNIKGPINYPPDTVASHASTAARTFAGKTAEGSVRRCLATAHAAATSPFARMPRAATNAPMSRSFFVRAFLPDAPRKCAASACSRFFVLAFVDRWKADDNVGLVERVPTGTARYRKRASTSLASSRSTTTT